ncbi:secreted M23 family peptidase [Mycobacterium avium subsp. avium 2285 (R)]|nr:secreted M23 family peptidase [Mycobacterium avium subsp. avium 2285 (R)]
MRWAALMLVVGLVGAVPAAAGDLRLEWPLRPPPVVVRAFDAPAQDWHPGHRGVDLAGTAGQPVYAAGAGPWCSPGCSPGGRWCRWHIPAGCAPATSPSGRWCGSGSR